MTDSDVKALAREACGCHHCKVGEAADYYYCRRGAIERALLKHERAIVDKALILVEQHIDHQGALGCLKILRVELERARKPADTEEGA